MDLIIVSHNFEKVIQLEKKEWLVFYYAGLSNILVALQKQNQEIDVWCNKAETFIIKADSLSKNNSEVYVLKSMLAAARIQVDKTFRIQKYGLLASKYASEALSLNNQNPRAQLVKAQVILNMPKVFGGGFDKAKPLFELVIDKSKSYKIESELYPKWGREVAELELMKRIKKQ